MATSLEYRHKGYANRLVKEALDELRKNDISFALLFTDPVKMKMLYGSVGFIQPSFDCKYSNINDKDEFIKNRSIMIAPGNNDVEFRRILGFKDPLDIGKSMW